LHLGNISINRDGICIYDCIEFNERFRYIDTASDIAFLAMDLDYNGYHGLSRFIVAEAARLMDDPGMYGVIDFYKCYRAFVRGKVESIKAFEPEVPGDEKEQSLKKAGRYFRLALRYALFGSDPAVIVTFGIIGTGKSTLAGMLAEELSCAVVASDAVRKEITGTHAGKKGYEGWEEGIYASGITDRTYREIISRALAEAGTNRLSVLDASFSKRVWREYLLREAGLKGAAVYFVRTTATLDEVELRLLRREKEGLSISDAGAALLPRFLAEWEEPAEIKGGRYFEADTERPGRELLDSLFRKIIDAGASSPSGQ
ncbi:MAG: AAA family ATPase, partial [Thermodesulfobacteriota bacterium]